jgi:GntR family transcriptional repressor for pyruvate dehydrogenase complex
MAIRIEKTKISEDIFIQLKDMIKDGTYKPGDKLPTESELTEMFGVSRTPVREALSVLEASGMIKSRHGGGSVVQAVSVVSLMEESILEVVEIDEVLQLLEVRIILESEAAALAAARRQQADIVVIEAALEEIRRAISAEETIGHEQDIFFHRSILEAAHNPILQKTMEGIGNLYYNSVRFSLNKNVGLYEKRRRVFHEHEQIAAAIRDGNSDAARKATVEHLSNARAKLEKYRENGGEVSDGGAEV